MTRRKRKPRRATYRETAELRRAAKLLVEIQNGGSYMFQISMSEKLAGAVEAARTCGGVVIVGLNGRVGATRAKP